MMPRGWTTLTLFLILFNGTFSLKIPVGVIFDNADESDVIAQQLFLANTKSDGSTFDLKIERVDGNDAYQVLQAANRLMKKSVFVLIVPSTSGGYSIIPSLSANIQIPVISLSEKPMNQEIRQELIVYIAPQTLRAVLDIMRFYQWSNIIYIYNKEDGPDRLQYLLELGSGALQLNVAGIHKLNSGERLNNIVRTISGGSINNILIDANEKDVEDLLKSAELEGTLVDHHFLIMNPVSGSFWKRNKDFGTLNITSFQLSNSNEGEDSAKPNEIQKALFADASKLTTDALSRFARSQANIIENSRHYFNSSSSSQFKHGSAVKQHIVETFVPDGLTGTLQLDQIGSRRGYVLSVVETRPGSTSESFTWTDPTGLKVLDPAYPRSHIHSFAKNTLIITAVQNIPFLMVKKSADGQDVFSGYLADLISQIAKINGFEYKIKLSPSNSYGRKDADGKWNGMIGEVIRGEADLALADITITSQRAQAIDFTVPYHHIGISMMIKKPDSQSIAQSSSPYFFLYVFNFETWCCLLVSFVGVGVLYYFVARITSITFDPRTGAKKELGLLGSLWYAFSALTLRNVGIYPKSISTRFLSAIWWLFVLFVLALYMGGLITALLIPIFGNAPSADDRAIYLKSPEKIIQESLQSGKPEIGLIHGGSTEMFFKTSSLNSYKSLSIQMSENPAALVRSTVEGIAKVRKGNGNFVFLMESATNEYHSNRYCDLAMLPQLLDSKSYGIVARKGSPYTNILSDSILKLQETGVLSSLQHKWWKNHNLSCIDENDEHQQMPNENNEQYKLGSIMSFTPITLHDISGLFYCLITGIILSMIICVAEYFIKRRRRGTHSMALTHIQKLDPLNGDSEIHHSQL